MTNTANNEIKIGDLVGVLCPVHKTYDHSYKVMNITKSGRYTVWRDYHDGRGYLNVGLSIGPKRIIKTPTEAA